MTWENADYLSRALRIWLRGFRQMVRERMESEFEDQWYPQEIQKVMGNKYLWPELKKNVARHPGRAIEEAFDPSHIKQILTAERTVDLFGQYFPHRDLLEARLQFVVVARNTEVAHPRDSELSSEELDEYLSPMLKLLQQTHLTRAKDEIKALHSQAIESSEADESNVPNSSTTRDAISTSAAATEEEAEWIPWVTESILGSKNKQGWKRVENVENDTLSRYPEFSDLLGANGDGFLDLIRRRPDVFDVTMPSRGRRGGQPYVRLVSQRKVDPDSLPDWTEILAQLLDGALARDRDTSSLLTPFKTRTQGLDHRDYGFSTFADLVATQPDLFGIIYTGHKKAVFRNLNQ